MNLVVVSLSQLSMFYFPFDFYSKIALFYTENILPHTYVLLNFESIVMQDSSV